MSVIENLIVVRKYTCCLIWLSLIWQSCKFQDNQLLEKRVVGFYKEYSSRKNLERFLSYYADSIIIEDIINGDRVLGKEAASKFFDWNNAAFQLYGDKALVVTDMLVDNHKAVVRGYFNRFKWGQTQIEAMHFTTLLTFDSSGKIVKQIDWINYPSTLIDWAKRKNSNKWIE